MPQRDPSFHPTVSAALAAADARAVELKKQGDNVSISPMYGGYFISNTSQGNQEEFYAETHWENT